ncbi:MAG: Hpt domain-containing protein, partial [Syntrophobacteraceae bacterium]
MISSGLIEIEKGGPEKHGEIIETIYRESHSLKGAARSVNRSDIVAICQALENTFSALKREEIAPFPRILDLLHQTVDYASDLIIGMEVSQAEKFGVGEIIRKLEETALQRHSVSGKEERTDIRPDSPAGEQEKAKEKTPRVDSIPTISTFIPDTPPVIVPAPSSTGT